jgi:hypothetical protein
MDPIRAFGLLVVQALANVLTILSSMRLFRLVKARRDASTD